MKSKCLVLGLLFFFFMSSPLWARTVTVIGEGQTRQAAINNGIRAAVEEALGSYITSSSNVAQGKLIYDRVTSASAGYVKSYNVIAEGTDPVTGVYKVKLNVVLDDIKLKSAVSQFMEDPRFQRTFQETKFDERKVVVLYKPRTGLDLPFNSKAVQSVMDLIQDRLSGKGFRVFLPSQLKRIRGRAAEMVIDEETAINIARQETGDAVVTYGYMLPNAYVIHALGPVYAAENDPAAKLAETYRNCMLQAEAKGIESVAFPAISTGIFGYPIEHTIEVHRA
jgi:hypothetical protein